MHYSALNWQSLYPNRQVIKKFPAALFSFLLTLSFEAITMYVVLLFNSDWHKIGTDTWWDDGYRLMMAQKNNIAHENVHRDILTFQKQYIHLLVFEVQW